MDARRLWEHCRWADRQILAALTELPEVPAPVLRELNHLLGADEVWLARLNQRTSRAPVWPELTLSEVGALADAVHGGFEEYLGSLDDSRLTALVPYQNSAGLAFETPINEILLHVALHAQYHRGKINALLRLAGQAPVPTDFITFSRGVPAAITPLSPAS